MCVSVNEHTIYSKAHGTSHGSWHIRYLFPMSCMSESSSTSIGVIGGYLTMNLKYLILLLVGRYRGRE